MLENGLHAEGRVFSGNGYYRRKLGEGEQKRRGRSKEGLPSDCHLYKKQGVDRGMVKQLDVTMEAGSKMTVVKSLSITAQIAIIMRKREMTTAWFQIRKINLRVPRDTLLAPLNSKHVREARGLAECLVCVTQNGPCLLL